MQQLEKAAQDPVLEERASSWVRHQGQRWNHFVLQVHAGVTKLFS